VPEEMRDAALILESLGVASVDINMGCPVKKVCKVGGGSAMMTELDKTSALVRGMVNAVKIPVTAKMRLGWDDDNLTAPDLARTLEDVGVAAIFVHGRTREQGFGGTVNLAGIRTVVEAVKTIPVIGNGDIVTPQAAKKMLDETGCAGVSIGRGAFYNPWIFQHTLAYLQGRAGSPLPADACNQHVEIPQNGAHGVTRPTAIAVTRKRSFAAFVAVEVSQSPSGVASPSRRWKTQWSRAPSPFGVTVSPSPW
jgi:nifR3 family TIM-barrel protein